MGRCKSTGFCGTFRDISVIETSGPNLIEEIQLIQLNKTKGVIGPTLPSQRRWVVNKQNQRPQKLMRYEKKLMRQEKKLMRQDKTLMRQDKNKEMYFCHQTLNTLRKFFHISI